MANYNLTNHNLYFFFIITSLPIITAFVPFVVKLILKLANYSSKLIHLQNQIFQLESEKQQISMVNQFAKYSKIERRINKLKQECTAINNQLWKRQFKVQICSYVILYATLSLITTYFLWSYRYVPLLIVPTHLLYPLNYLLAFPTQIDGAIGITCWLFLVGYITNKAKKFISSL